jgi:hypothetical protein
MSSTSGSITNSNPKCIAMAIQIIKDTMIAQFEEYVSESIATDNAERFEEFLNVQIRDYMRVYIGNNGSTVPRTFYFEYYDETKDKEDIFEFTLTSENLQSFINVASDIMKKFAKSLMI